MVDGRVRLGAQFLAVPRPERGTLLVGLSNRRNRTRCVGAAAASAAMMIELLRAMTPQGFVVGVSAPRAARNPLGILLEP